MSGTASGKLLFGQAAGVEILDDTGAVGRRGWDLSATEKEGAERDVPEAKLPILEHDDTIEPGHQEDDNHETEGGANADNGAGDLGAGQCHLVAAALPQQKHAEQRGGDAEVDGHHYEGLVDGI